MLRYGWTIHPELTLRAAALSNIRHLFLSLRSLSSESRQWVMHGWSHAPCLQSPNGFFFREHMFNSQTIF
jgi:hypothetical protein